MIYLFENIQNYSRKSLDHDIASLPVAHRQRIQKYTNINRQKLSTIGIKLLMYGLKHEYDCTDMPAWAYGKYGKPYFKVWENIHFNISHCPDAVACALDINPIGIDVQDTRRANKPQVWKRVCSSSELDELTQANDPASLFTRFWSLKESYVKYTGEGIGQDLKKLDFSNCQYSIFQKNNLNFSIIQRPAYICAICSVQTLDKQNIIWIK